jgi:hypothetical protein
MTDNPNTLRRSTAPDNAAVLNNYPGRYPTEDWMARYWAVNEEGNLEQRQVRLQLPRGFGDVCTPVTVGHPGCVRVVRRWGFGCYPEILNEIGFDFTPLLTNPEDDAEWLSHYFLLYDPAGTLKGSYTQWRTHLGALSYMVGGVDASFVRLQVENNALYQQAMAYILQANSAAPSKG